MVRVLPLLITLAAAGAAIPAFAQSPIVPASPSYATTPGNSSALPPLQQQILESYRSQLQQTQRELLLQNPSGLSRKEIEVGRQLNTFDAMPSATYAAPSPSAVSRASRPAYYAPSAEPETAPTPARHVAHQRAPRQAATPEAPR